LCAVNIEFWEREMWHSSKESGGDERNGEEIW
jgi:hypothetical protein